MHHNQRYELKKLPYARNLFKLYVIIVYIYYILVFGYNFTPNASWRKYFVNELFRFLNLSTFNLSVFYAIIVLKMF